MALDLEYCARMHHGKNKLGLESLASTSGGDTSSESMQSADDNLFLDSNVHSSENDTPAECCEFPCLPEEDPESPFLRLDRHDFPSTRENSPEPLWRSEREPGDGLAEQMHAHAGRSHFPTEPSVGWNNAYYNWSAGHVPSLDQAQGGPLPRQPALQRVNMNMPTQPFQMFVVAPALVHAPHQGVSCTFPMNQRDEARFPLETAATQAAARTPPTLREESSRTEPNPVLSSCAPPAQAPAQKRAQTKEGNGETAVASSKKSGKAKNRGHAKSESMFDKLSAEQKESLCKYIYDFMVQKDFTSPEGYLVVDVFSEVMKDMSGSADCWRVAQHRFGDLLQSAPQYFRLFRKSIRIANHCCWYARKGQKTVSLVLEAEK
jgi:hypothetical protein